MMDRIWEQLGKPLVPCKLNDFNQPSDAGDMIKGK
jgi:hypothetical protein